MERRCQRRPLQRRAGRRGAGARPPPRLHGQRHDLGTAHPGLRPRLRHGRDRLLDHGASSVPAEPARYQMEHAVADLTGLLDQLGIARAAWLGYSMGGRVALRFAVERPAKVAALVLEGAAPGIADPAERAHVFAATKRWRISSSGRGWRRSSTAGSACRFSPPRLGSGRGPGSLRRQRLANDPVGLANSLRGLGQGTQEPLHDRLGKVEAPTLLVVGEEDAKFRCLATEISSAMPTARVAIVAGAGHAPHLEQPTRSSGLCWTFSDPWIGSK